MQIVIEIDDDDYQFIKDTEFANYVVTQHLYEAVYEGKPLPKRHGRLIIKPTEEDIAKTVGGQNDFAECIRDAVIAVFDNAPTIIEADVPDTDVGKMAESEDAE
jgi:hypothetical protein